MPAESGVAEVGPCKATLVKATAFSIAYIQYLFPIYHPIIITGASEAQGLPLKPVWDTKYSCYVHIFNCETLRYCISFMRLF